MTSRDKYREYCHNNSLHVFFNDWWLDAVCGKDNWDVVIYEKNGIILGVLPFYIKKQAIFLTNIKMPLLTHYLGPLINYPPDQKYASKIGFENEVLDYLYSNLPKFHLLRNRFNPKISNW